MSGTFDLKAFYQNIKNEPGRKKFEVGHFDFFKIQDMALSEHKMVAYSRRSFFKVTLVTGENRLNFADKSIEVNGTALVFTNPAIPYYWDRVSNNQKSYMCIFTAPFFNRFGNVNDFPIFQFTDAAVVQLEAEQVFKYTALFEKMFQELQGNYLYKYELLRNQLTELFTKRKK